MTSRERWTVYPLLFLALGLAMRAVLVPPEQVGELEAIRLKCRELVVVDPRGTPVVHAGRIQGDGGGRIEVRDGAGLTAVAIGAGTAGQSAAVEFYDADGREIDRIVPAGTMLPPPGSPSSGRRQGRGAPPGTGDALP
jgi:hypothetical protein